MNNFFKVLVIPLIFISFGNCPGMIRPKAPQMGQQAQSPLHAAAASGNIALIRQLLNTRRINVNMLDAQGNTALHIAALNNHKAAARTLIEEYLANTALRNRSGQTALEVALSRGNSDVVEYLLNIMNAPGKQPAPSPAPAQRPIQTAPIMAQRPATAHMSHPSMYSNPLVGRQPQPTPASRPVATPFMQAPLTPAQYPTAFAHLQRGMNALQVAAPSPAPQQPQPAVMHTCTVCFDEKELSKMTTLACGHEYCAECLEGVMDVAIQEGSAATLKCPDPRCARPIAQSDISRITTDRTRIQRMSAIFIKEQQMAQQKPISDVKPNLAQLNKEDLLTEQWKREHTKPCPRCHTIIEKTAGCNKMQCPTCRYYFCYQCMGTLPHGCKCQQPRRR